MSKKSKTHRNVINIKIYVNAGEQPVVNKGDDDDDEEMTDEEYLELLKEANADYAFEIEENQKEIDRLAEELSQQKSPKSNAD